MPEESLKKKTVKGMFWSSLERFSVQAVQFLVMIVIARLLSPEEYGLIGMLAIFIAVSQSLVNSGFSQALIRKQNRSDKDNCTVFYFNIVVSLVLYLVLFLLAPSVARFYKEPILCDVLRVISIGIIINSLVVVQLAIYTTALDFRTQAKASFSGAVVSGFVGIYLAYSGFGVWALVWQQLVNYSVIAIILWIYSKWFPKLTYSWKSFRELFGFGSKLMLSGLLDTTYNNAYQLVIGKFFSASTLGFYSRAYHFSEFPSSNINNVVQRVTYPVLCSMQDNDSKLREVYRKFLRLSAFIIFPLMCLLAGVAFPFIEVILGEQWRFVSVLLIPICFNMMWYPIHSINLNLLQVKGRSDLFLKLEIIKKCFGCLFLVCSVPFGVIAMCYVGIVQSLVSLVINSYYSGKLIGVGFLMQIRDLSLTLILSLSTFGLVFLFCSMDGDKYLLLFGGAGLGAMFFMLSSWVFRFKEIDYLKDLLLNNKRNYDN